MTHALPIPSSFSHRPQIPLAKISHLQPQARIPRPLQCVFISGSFPAPPAYRVVKHKHARVFPSQVDLGKPVATFFQRESDRKLPNTIDRHRSPVLGDRA